MTDRELLNMAFEAAENAYAPYSGLRVGAALECDDGSVFLGCNVENSAFGPTNCAERTAVFKAVSEGYRPGDLEELHLMVGSGNIGMPCFMCRQVITEFFEQDKKIFCYSTEGDMLTYKVSDLCPNPFGPDDLK